LFWSSFSLGFARQAASQPVADNAGTRNGPSTHIERLNWHARVRSVMHAVRLPTTLACGHGAKAIVTSTPRKPGFNYSLNGYRGFCALLVFLFHAGSAGVISTPDLGPSVDFLWTSLRYGVEMFFMISGYVILGSLLRHTTIAGFLTDRFIRIYSAWLPALVSVSVVCAVFRAKMFANVTGPEGLGLFLANFFLLPPLIPVPLVHWGSWSLTYEWVFYLAAAVGAILLRQRAGEPRWAVGLWVVLVASFVAMFPRATFFATGVLVFLNARWFESQRRWLGFPLVSLLVFLVAWRFTNADEAALSTTYLDWLRDGRWIFAIVAFLASVHMFASAVCNASRQFAFLESGVFQFFGNVSYSFYLWHSLVMSAVKRVVTPYLVPHIGLVGGFIVFFLASGVIALAVSWASWTLFEVKLAKVAHRFLTSPKELQGSRAT
jgi:peptidoglycan/LPS O-acetylase OafA/YrhL